MEHNLFRYIWRNSWRDQSLILVVVAISHVFYFVSLDLPKQIVNQAIQGEAFEGGRTTAPFLDLSDRPDRLARHAGGDPVPGLRARADAPIWSPCASRSCSSWS